MVIDKIVLSADKSWCMVHVADGPSLKYDFIAMGVNHVDGIQLIYMMHSEDVKLAS